MCRSCGALVGAGETHCMMCGMPSTANLAPQQSSRGNSRRAVTADPETLRFLRDIISRPAAFTIIFISVNVFLYLLMTLTPGGATGEVLIAYGAKLNYLIREQGEWWRFVAPVFLHVNVPGLGPLHLLVNMYSLFMLGPYVEKLYGSARFVVFWVVTGIAGVVASYLTVQPEMQISSVGRFLFKSQDVPSAGASGALFGLVGVLFVFGIKYRKELPEGFKRAFGTGMLPMIFINLFIGYAARGFIDNAAHLGGLACGMLFALFVGYKRPGERGPVSVVWHVLQALSLLLVVASFVMVARHYGGPPPSLRNLGEQFKPSAQATGVTAFVEAMNEGQKTFEAAGGGRTDALPPAIQKLSDVPDFKKNADEVRAEWWFFLTRAVNLYAVPPKGDAENAAHEQESKQLSADYGEWEGRFDQWVETEGRRQYGLVLEQKPSPQPSAEDEK